MEHSLFHSKFKSSVERSSLLDIIGDSPLGENPHREVAMELIFYRTIDGCRKRMLAQKKSGQADPVVQPSSREKLPSTLTAATIPTTTHFSSPGKRSKAAALPFGGSLGLFGQTQSTFGSTGFPQKRS